MAFTIINNWLENNAKLDFKKWKQFAIEYSTEKLKSYRLLYCLIY